MKHRSGLLAVVAIVGVSVCSLGAAQEYDLVIKNGRVMDPETTFDAVANVGVKDGRIAIITRQKISGRETIEADGLVVVPAKIS